MQQSSRYILEDGFACEGLGGHVEDQGSDDPEDTQPSGHKFLSVHTSFDTSSRE